MLHINHTKPESVVPNLFLCEYNNEKEEVHVSINAFTSSMIASASRQSYDLKLPRYNPLLTDDELKEGCKLGIDSWADTSCAGKHAYIDAVVEGKTVTANAFSSELPTLKNLEIVHAKYAYDADDGRTYILCVNNSIHVGPSMENSLLCPNQCRDNGLLIDTRPKMYCPHDELAQCVMDPVSQLKMPILHHGPMPYLPVRKPTNEELLTCDEIVFTGLDEWNPYEFSLINATTSIVHGEYMNLPEWDYDEDYYYDLMSFRQLSQVNTEQLLLNDIDRFTSVFGSKKKESLTPIELSRLWKIGLKTATRTLKATTHQCIRTTGALTRRFRTDRTHMRYKQLSMKHGKFYVDTLFSKVKSIRGFTCGNLYTNNLGFKKFFPMESNNQLESAGSLKYLVEMIGLPNGIHADNHKTFTEGAFKSLCSKFHIPQTFTEPYSPWQNRAEGGIKEVKSYAYKIMNAEDAPMRIWCFAFEYASDVLALMATGLYQLEARTPYEHVMHYTPDISEYVNFRWYQWSYYWDELNKEKKLCRWLGVAHKVGQSFCYWILLSNGEFLARSSVIPIPDEDLESIELKERMAKFSESLHDVIGDADGYEYNKKLSSPEYKPQQPFSNAKYKPELDTSAVCSDTELGYYQNLIGILRWCVELGRIDIGYEASRMSQYLANPRIGHLHQVLHIFKYLDVHQENFISFDPTKLELPAATDPQQCHKYKARMMKEMYPDAEEATPPNAPVPRGKSVQLNIFVDSDHAGNVVTRRSHTGIIMFLNMAPIYWYSKRQNTVESSTFSSEFVALKTACELTISMRYKLRMMGVPIEGPARIFCDNEAVYKNASMADSVLRKKHNSIAYHRVRECVAAGICYIIKEETGSNLADILTKSLPKEQRIYLRRRIMVNAKVNKLKKD